jgi:hypothetical protein
MVESEFILLGTERDSDGVPWTLLASDRDGRLEFAGPAILNPPQALRAAWRERMAELVLAKPPPGRGADSTKSIDQGPSRHGTRGPKITIFINYQWRRQ